MNYLSTQCIFQTLSLRYDFCIKTMFGSSLPPVVFKRPGLMSYLRYLCLLVYSGVQHILSCVFVSFFFVLCTLNCQFLWIVQFGLPLRYSQTFIYSTFKLIKLHIYHHHTIKHKYHVCLQLQA